MIKKLLFAIYICTLPVAHALTASAVSTDRSTPSVDKTSISIYARRRTGTYEEIEKRGHAAWGWTPQIDFKVNGPVSDRAVLTVEFTKPDGSSWLKLDCETGAAPAGGWWQVKACGQDIAEEQLTREVGLYGLRIGIKDDLASRTAELFTGKVKVGKFFAGGNQTTEKEHYGYYVDYDWRLALAQIYPQEPEEGYEQEFAPLAASFWFRGDVQGEVSAHLFHNGREISNTKDTTKGTWLGETTISTFDKSKFDWKQQRFTFTNTLVFNNEAGDNHPNAFRMDKIPGEYEIKVMRRGILVRSAKFTVGANGRIVDNQIATQNSLGSRRMLVVATVTGDEDGAKPDLDAWRTSAFFGGPLKGLAP